MPAEIASHQKLWLPLAMVVAALSFGEEITPKSKHVHSPTRNLETNDLAGVLTHDKRAAEPIADLHVNRFSDHLFFPFVS